MAESVRARTAELRLLHQVAATAHRATDLTSAEIVAIPELRTVAQRALEEVSKTVLAAPGVDHAVAIAGISPLDNSASLQNAGAVYVILKDWSQRGAGTGADLRSLYFTLQAALDKILDANCLLVIPPPIQGIGNASGFTMQVELRDGGFDYPKLERLTRSIVADGATI